LEILSFCNSNGVVIDASIPGDIQVLRPIQDGPVAQCRPSNVAYAEVRHIIHFDILEPNEPISPLALVFYIKLPQSTTVRVNGQGNNYQLTTFHGDANLREMEMEAIQATILDITHQDGPYTLSTPGFAQQGTVADSVEISDRIKEQILSKGKEAICDAIFKSLCPSHSANPHSIVETIYQLVKDSNGNCELLSINQYDAKFHGSTATMHF